MDSNPLYDDIIPPGSAAGGTASAAAVPDIDARTEATGESGSRSRSSWPGEQVLLASIGAAATAVDTAGQCFDQLVQRGERAQGEWQDRAEDLRRQNAGARGRARNYFRGAMDMFLDTLNIPSRTDIDTVNVKLNILTRKLDDLQTQTAAAPATPAEPPIQDPPITGDLAT